MGSVLTELLNYKQQKDARSNADLNAIPQAALMLQRAKQQQYDNMIKGALTQATLAGSGISLNPQTNSLNAYTSPANQLKNLLTVSSINKNNATVTNLQNKPALDAEKQQVKQDAQDQKSWEKIVRNSDPSLASSRSTFGMASNGNLRADRALSTLQNNKILTNQDAQNIVADIAGIYAGGAPSDQGMKHSQYESIQQRIAGLQQYINGKPTDALPPDIKNHLTQVIGDLKNVNNEAIKSHFDYQEKANSGVISKYQDEWNQMKGAYVSGDSSNISDGATGTYNGKPVVRQGGKWVLK
ncbi:hypothetical protein KW791_00565 [Candidatus Parcubacteria bacterium]|nr:hypothetical protein [Candidatus Parcubacteria bacterium]